MVFKKGEVIKGKETYMWSNCNDHELNLVVLSDAEANQYLKVKVKKAKGHYRKYVKAGLEYSFRPLGLSLWDLVDTEKECYKEDGDYGAQLLIGVNDDGSKYFDIDS